MHGKDLLLIPIKSIINQCFILKNWRRVPESNRCTRICNPLRHHSANSPKGAFTYHLLGALQALRDLKDVVHGLLAFTTVGSGLEANATACPKRAYVVEPIEPF